MTSVRSRLALLSAVLLPATLALAQQQAVTPGPQAGPTGPAPETWHASFNPYTSHSFDTDVRGTDAQIAVTRAGLDTNARIPLSHELNLNLGILAEYSNYHFEHAGTYLGSNTVNLDVLYIPISTGLSYKLSDEWSVFGGALIQASGETGADVGDSMMYGGYAGFTHKVSDHLSYTFGVGGRSQIEDDPQFFPILGLDWDINDSLTLTLSGSAGGAQIRLSQSLVYDLAISLVSGYEGRQFRLDDVPTQDGVLRDTSVPITVELAWRPNAGFVARASAGYVVWQEIEFDDADGHRLSKKHSDPTPFLGVSALWQF